MAKTIHPSDGVLGDFLLGRLDDERSRAVEEHLDRCEVCCGEMSARGEHRDRFVDELFKVGTDPRPPSTFGLDTPATSARDSGELRPPAIDLLAEDRGARGNEPSGEMPKRVGRFSILRELGRGGFGVVYLAYDATLQRQVALKIPRFGPDVGVDTRERFLREARAAAGLEHPNIASVYEANCAGSLYYLVSAYCPGLALLEWLRARQGPVPAADAALLVAQLADGIHHAHVRGVVHRDLKPGNVILQTVAEQAHHVQISKEGAGGRRCDVVSLADCVPRIVDFGLAKVMSEASDETRTGILIGTAGYMAPEQTRGRSREITPSADVYSLGAILYELLTSRPPFQAETTLDLLQQVRSADPIPPTRLRARLPQDLETICLKCLEKEPGQRYASAADLSEDLRRFLAREPIVARPVSRWSRIVRWCARHPSTAALSIAVATLVAVLAVGSSVAAVRLRSQISATKANLQRAVDAERGQTRRLWRAYVAEAEAGLFSRRAGQRFATLDGIAKAVELSRTLEVGDQERTQLRNIAIAALALPDLRVNRGWSCYPVDTPAFGIGFDGECERYARKDGAEITVRRVIDNADLLRLPSGASNDSYPILSFSPDGGFLACKWGNEGTLQLWELASQNLRWEARGVPGVHLDDIAFSPDGRRLAFSAVGGGITVRDLITGSERCLPGAGETPRSLRFRPDGRALAFITHDRLAVLDLDSGERLPFPRVSCDALAWSRDGKSLAIAQGERVELFDPRAGKSRVTLRGHQSTVIHVAFANRSDLLATTSWDGTTRLWDCVTGEHRLSCPGYALGFSHDDRWLAFGYLGHEVGRWEVALGDERWSLSTAKLAERAALSPDGRLLVVAGNQGLEAWDLLTRRPVLQLPAEIASRATFAAATGTLFTSGQHGLYRWPIRRSAAGSPKDGDPAADVVPDADPSPDQTRSRGTKDTAERLCLGPPSRILDFTSAPWDGHDLSVSDDESILAIRRTPGKVDVLRPNEPSEPPRAVMTVRPYPCLSPNGRWLAIGSHHESGLELHDLRTGERVSGPFDTLGTGTTVAFSPEGGLLACGTGREYRFWESGDWRLRRVISREHAGSTSGVSFSPDGEFVATSHSPWTLGILSAASGEVLLRLPAPGPDLWLGWTGDRRSLRQLVVIRARAHIEVWELERLREQLRRLDLDWAPSLDSPPRPPAAAQPSGLATDFGSLAETCLRHRAELRCRSGDYALAVDDFRDLLSVSSDRGRDANSLAWLLANYVEVRPPLDEALARARESCELAPKLYEYRNTLGVVHYRRGEWREAIEALERARSLEPSGGTAFDDFFLAMSHQALGDTESARAAYSRALAWWMRETSLPDALIEELTRFRAETERVLSQPAHAERPPVSTERSPPTTDSE